MPTLSVAFLNENIEIRIKKCSAFTYLSWPCVVSSEVRRSKTMGASGGMAASRVVVEEGVVMVGVDGADPIAAEAAWNLSA